MSKITINGITYSGNNVVISNGTVFIDGKNMSTESKTITINIIGDINSLNVDYCNKIEITGNVSNVKTTNGDVSIIGHVTETVQTTSGDVDCITVGNSITTTSGDVDCGTVGGSVKTNSGDIKYKK